MDKSEEISLESSLLGFCLLNKDVLFVKNHGIVVRNDEDYLSHPENCVMLISGGGSGHEPGHNGFVGQGMLAAVVSGNVFTSPSSDSVLAAILLAADEKREILLIINNYTGDRLNFGLAMETAQNVHHYRNVELLLVDDDCSIDNPRPSTGRRGLAGCALVHKIAGAMASTGSSLHDIHSVCSDLLAKRLIRTIGFSFEYKSNQLTQIEIGYGIHGEPGCLRVESEKNFKPVNSILADKLRLWDVDVGCVLLFNNLGGTSEYIFYEFIREFLELAKELSLKISRIYAGKFLTSLSKQALSVSVLEIHDPKLLDYLSFPVKTPAGHLFNDYFELCKPAVKEFQLPQTVRSFSKNAQVTAREIDITKAMIEGASKALLASKQSLNDIDSELGDGDTGSTLSRGAEALLLELSSQKIALQDPFVMLSQISSVLMKWMGGTSGALFSIFFQCASGAFSVSSDNRHSVGNWMRAVASGMEGVKKHGKANIGDRTLLDSLDFGYKAALGKSGDAGHVLAAFVVGCREGAEATINMIPKSGRSAYTVGDDIKKYDLKSKNPDAGAQAIYLISAALAKAFESSVKEFP